MKIVAAVKAGAIAVTFLSFSAFAQTCPAGLPEEFKIELIRLGQDEVVDHGLRVKRLYGDIGVNNKNLGRFYENPARKIPAGTYKGLLRYQSEHNFVQSACGAIARDGDFLLEVSNVKQDGRTRSNILFHPGGLPSNSDGCVLFGARKFDAQGKPLPLDADYPLVKLRREFYGTDNPVSCPNKQIAIIVKDP